MTLSQALAALAEASRRHAGRVLLAALLLAVLSAGLAWWRLGVSTDTDALFSASLPWRQRALQFDRDFPQFRDLLVAVIDADTPEQADATAEGLAQALAADTAHFAYVRRPDASPWFDANGLLFLDQKDLQDVLDRIIDAQPFLGQLVADPSARGLFAAMSLMAIGAGQGVDLAPFAAPLKAFHATLADALAGRARPLSWQTLLGGGLADRAGKFRFVLARAKLDLGALEPGEAATMALRRAAAGLDFVRAGQAHVRLTGAVALQDEEFATVSKGALAGTLGSAALVLVWLVLGLRSWRLIVPVVVTLVFGLLVTTGFAAAAIGTLNMISVAFAVLFVGIAVDFAIQFCVRAREMRMFHAGDTVLGATGAVAGPPILIAAAAAAAGFLAFAPTSFRGVAELGMIAGFGMLVAFAATMTVLPALLGLTQPRGEAAEVGLAAGAAIEAWLQPRRRWVLALFAVAGIAGAFAAPRLRFDSDPLHTKDPTTEAMTTLADLAAQPLTNPYSVEIITPSEAEADRLAARLDKVPQAAEVLTLSRFVPQDQPPKLAAIADAASLLRASLAPRAPAMPVTAPDLRLAARATAGQIDHAAAQLAPDAPLRAIGADLAALAQAPDATLMAANDALVRFLPVQLDHLRTALAAHEVSVADLPPGIARDWRLPDGRVRVQVVPKPDSDLAAFVAAVRAIAPEAGGPAVEIVETTRTIVAAFRQAAIGAALAITAILALILRRPLDVGLVLLALALSALLTALGAVLLGMRLNFANIIALPLLQGVGVSFNIYFVANWRAGQARFLGTATARGILFSALTTATAFGSLALSQHPGTASMGRLLLLSLGATLVVTLLFMPALLRSMMREPE